jgi:hypothetical protein
MNRYVSLSLCGLLALAITGSALSPAHTAPNDPKEPDAVALKRARREVRMLDDIYKTAIVLITDKYVKTRKDYPAGRAAIKWLRDVSEKGHPEVRLIDVSGEPYSPSNTARDAFEKEGVKQLRAGKGYFDRVEHKDGKSYLRAITAIPVVSEKCILCHDHYKLAKKGEAVGALTYTVPIE